MIPFHTLSQRHLVYVYCVVWLLQFGYAAWLAVQWRASREHAFQGNASRENASQEDKSRG